MKGVRLMKRLQLKILILVTLSFVLSFVVHQLAFGITYYCADCPSSDNIWCPSNAICQPASHCDVWVPHRFYTTNGLKYCVGGSGSDTCEISTLYGCWAYKYNIGDTTCSGGQMGSVRLAACYKICGS